ncbi:MAG: hypothetical protein MAG715_00325 [Methanonatronarchaeales archaeon]|nr:hypothetical protein [Methanonatronarchaeales archaeon]
MSEYRPGVCNIGRDQALWRYLIGAIGFSAAALYVYWFVGSGLPRLYLAAASFPLWVGLEGVLQARLRFCAAFGAMGVFDLRGSGGTRGRVTEGEDHRRDVRRAIQIHVYSAAAAVVVTASLYLLL